jgi:hypothetical protein
VSWMERIVEQQIAEAIAKGELDPGALKGTPIADLDAPRRDGWWAERFVERELSHDRRVDALAAAAAARAGFWRATDEDALRTLVTTANRAVDAANVNLVPGDRIERFVADDIVARWRDLTGDVMRGAGRSRSTPTQPPR